MIRRLLPLLLLGAAAQAEERPLPVELPPFAAERPLPAPHVVKSRLPEGLTVWVVPRPGFPKADVLLVVRGGMAADPVGQEGMTGLLATGLRDGTAKRSAKAIAEELQAVGGELTTAGSEDAIQLGASGLASGVGRLVEIVADIARHAAFPEKEVALDKDNALETLAADEAQPEFVGRRAFARAVFGEHPYHTVAATKEVIAGVTPEALRREFTRRFRPERALVLVVGDVEPAQVTAAVARAFAGWKGVGEMPPTAKVAAAPSERRILLVDRPDSVQAHILVGRLAPTMNEPGYYPALVATTLFGGMFSARLVRNLREDKGYTYTPDSRMRSFEKAGFLGVDADVRNEVTAPSLVETFYEMDRMWATAPTAEELARTKRFLAGLYLLRNQLQDALAGTLAKYWVMGLAPEALAEYVPRINAVDAEQIRGVAQKIFPSLQQTVVVVGDAARIKDALGRFGAVTVVKP
jgi:zinc protease